MHADTLPQLTPEEASAVGVALASIDPMLDVSSKLETSLLKLYSILARPQCQAHINMARRIARARAEACIADAIPAALYVLKQICENPDADPTERRRAASTIVRANRPALPRQLRPKRRSTDPFDRQPQLPAKTSDVIDLGPRDATRQTVEAPSQNNQAAPQADPQVFTPLTTSARQRITPPPEPSIHTPAPGATTPPPNSHAIPTSQPGSPTPPRPPPSCTL